MVFMAPGMSTLITPAQVQMHFASDVSAGFFERSVPVLGGTHGAAVAGMHGEGAPSFAITVGFVGAVHMPKGMMFTMGTWSMIVAAGFPSTIGVPGRGSTFRAEGAAPNVHISWAPATTCGGMPRR